MKKTKEDKILEELEELEERKKELKAQLKELKSSKDDDEDEAPKKKSKTTKRSKKDDDEDEDEASEFFVCEFRSPVNNWKLIDKIKKVKKVISQYQNFDKYVVFANESDAEKAIELSKDGEYYKEDGVRMFNPSKKFWNFCEKKQITEF